ncbi:MULTISPECIES: metal ABC transporter ATP-binding protein [Streptococcus]|uniref:Metal ABC transporter ATP-binding protein n=1 Tax=Streptococcus ruminantium TaxID=1917441 RepID=A0A2Z5U5U9_9STRE|nr:MULTISPECIES: metal ABC transporter ATP-binding protein [Streptococcus]MDQ8780058.1 metal ABC transporter ATP-binding protein [Streptococcus ruminantium]QHF55553.1 manganese ABC transporter ATP-binding protein [Streptococcus sp. DAT741]BBA93528.1 metal ABC transporter ATP-binding protein [Streptococcus ruminantium]BDD41536.1 Mn/Zn ABC-type transport system ATP-binding protein [Streptococcus ruminantium]BDD43494.1 Mn/Zn ABC-type transport system ATP-binding protein [Streptococcus ruminantium
MFPIIELEDVSLAYAASQTLALEKVDLAIPKGSRTAIVGPNGAGKSSLFKVILGLQKPDSGRVSLFGQQTELPSLIAQKVAYIPQSSQVNWQFPATVFEIVLMGRFAHSKGILRRPSKEDRLIVEQALERMKITDLRHRQIDQLSGGQRQRVFLARALAQEAELYLMDEPLAGIDQATEMMIMDILKEFQQEGKTSVVIHHDLTTLESYFDHLVWLHKQVVASGPIEQALTVENYQATYGIGTGIFLRNTKGGSHV